jgi:hypothetical protein
MKKENDLYSKDSKIIKDSESDISGQQNISDLISQDSHLISNPPKFQKNKGNNNLYLCEQPEEEKEKEDKNKNNEINEENIQDIDSKNKLKNKKRKDSDDKISSKNNIKNYFKNFYNEMTEKNINKVIEYNDELLNLKDFSQKYQNFISIYLADLKRHHILYFSFCCDINNIFLKLSFFSLTITLYFAINTFLIVDSNMSDAYYDKTKAKPLYIIMNLFLPFLICGLISFAIKLTIMPQFYINKIIKTIQNNDKLKNLIHSNKKEIKNEENNKNEEIIEVKKERRRHCISNEPKNISKEQKYELNKNEEYQKEKIRLEKEFGLIYSSYSKKVIIYYAASFVVLGFIWYMMTSFCAIFKNSGVKLILNSFISIFASFLLPFILGLIPSGFGFLSIKLNSEVIYMIYKFINIVL